MTAFSQWRNWFAVHLGVNHDRKLAVYLDLMRSVSLRDASYWLQVLFSAGIATLGLVLNSPAVIIGAMLISPLMGPILANGLAFAAGDLVLAIRALVCLNLSCGVAMVFATLLIGVMPFKEMTSEIAARTNPNALDLVIALFSGALGAIATCKDSKGVVNAVPGVAIAVALMPPLCVVGYGVGVAFSLDSRAGLQAAGGGGLLLLTNLTAITFVAMLVFLLLNLDTPELREQVNLWHRQDIESNWVQGLLERFPTASRWQKLGSLRNRLFLIIVPILVLLIPLGQALGRLQSNYTLKQRENQIEQTAKTLWNESFATSKTGTLLSSIDTFRSEEQAGQLALIMTIFTQKTYSEREQQTFVQRFSDQLNRDTDTVSLQLIQIPTASSELLTQLTNDAQPEPAAQRPASIADLQQQLQQALRQNLDPLALPDPARLIGYDLHTRTGRPPQITLNYLSDRTIGPDGRSLLTQMVQQRLSLEEADVDFIQVVPEQGILRFQPNQLDLTPDQQQQLAAIGERLQQYPQLALTLTAQTSEQELLESITTLGTLDVSEQRQATIATYLEQQWQILPNRLTLIKGNELATPQLSQMRLTLRLATEDVATEGETVLTPETLPTTPLPSP